MNEFTGLFLATMSRRIRGKDSRLKWIDSKVKDPEDRALVKVLVGVLSLDSELAKEYAPLLSEHRRLFVRRLSSGSVNFIELQKGQKEQSK